MDGISVLGDDREYIYMNEAHAAVFGYDSDDLIGSSWRRLYSHEEASESDRSVQNWKSTVSGAARRSDGNAMGRRSPRN